ncbi:hypothetical protein DL765_003750 [Monosporascus sp. GIB2]|nr:hypothetical protein DL765_003750 [Monosporascus sp. GIB2]
MGGISPLQLLIIPFLFLFALPLGFFACITTALAFFVLYVRFTMAYLDVGLETANFVLFGNGAHNQQFASRGTASPRSLSSGTSASTKHRHGRKRRGSASSGSLTPVAGLNGAPLTPGIGLDRDFEGIGGWRIDTANIGRDVAGDEQWYNLNSRLELPSKRHYFRSHSGAAVLPGTGGGALYSKAGKRAASESPGDLKMTASANSSRPRTPSSTRYYGGRSLADGDEYFPLPDKKHARKLTA